MRAFCLFVWVTGCQPIPHPADEVPDAAGDVEKADEGDLVAGPDFCSATDPRAVGVEIVATPEAGEQPYLDALDSAQSSIRVEIYEMGFGGILDQLTAKAAASVQVRVIFDQSKKSINQKYYDQLLAAGAEVKWSDPQFTFQHAKVCVVDDRVAVISTGNYSKSYSITLERNFVATDRDPADLSDLVALFDADWAGTAPTLACTRLVVSPINARPRILDLIASAQTTLTIESMQFADTNVRQAVAARVTAGVEVRVMLAEPSWIDANADAAMFLKGLGVSVKSIPHLHTKVIVVDGARAYLGSENLSFTSLDRNREVGLIVTDATSISPLTTTFEKDWNVGVDL